MRIKIKNKLNFFIFIKAKNMFKLKNIYEKKTSLIDWIKFVNCYKPLIILIFINKNLKYLYMLKNSNKISYHKNEMIPQLPELIQYM